MTAAGILRLIAVAQRLLRAEDRQQCFRRQPADPRECIRNDLRLDAALRFIGDMLHRAAAALRKRAAAFGPDAVGRGRDDPLNDRIGQRFQHLDDPHLQHIPRNRLCRKYGKTAEAADALSFCGHSGDLKRDDLVFAERCCFLPPAHCSFVPQPGQNVSPPETSRPQVGQVTVPPRCTLRTSAGAAR